jgi:NitT/TauT family transport system permease protein
MMTALRAGGSILGRRVRALVPAVVAFFALGGIWEGFIKLFDIKAFLLPAPSEIISTFFETFGTVWEAGFNTLFEALGGFVFGTIAAVLVAIATARWEAARAGIMPFAIAANAMPILAIAPISNAMFGLASPISKMVVAGIVVFLPVMINTARGLIEVDAAEIELMRSLAASEGDILRRIRIPNALPYFFSGLRVGTALAMIAAIVAEYFGGPQDVLGQYILTKASLLQIPEAWAGIVVASILGIALYLAVLGLERVAMPWHQSFRTESA